MKSVITAYIAEYHIEKLGIYDVYMSENSDFKKGTSCIERIDWDIGFIKQTNSYISCGNKLGKMIPAKKTIIKIVYTIVSLYLKERILDISKSVVLFKAMVKINDRKINSNFLVDSTL